MYFVDEDGEIGITYLDPMEAFMIYDESILQRPRYFVRTYKDIKNIVHGSVSDGTVIRYFDINPSLKFRDEDEKVHGFDGVPAVEYVANAERQGIFEPVLSMVDAYNKAISEKANDVDYFADAYMKILGAKLEEEDLQHIRENRIVNFDGIGDGNLVVEFMQKPSADTTQENLVQPLELVIDQPQHAVVIRSGTENTLFDLILHDTFPHMAKPYPARSLFRKDLRAEIRFRKRLRREHIIIGLADLARVMRFGKGYPRKERLILWTGIDKLKSTAHITIGMLYLQAAG